MDTSTSFRLIVALRTLHGNIWLLLNVDNIYNPVIAPQPKRPRMKRTEFYRNQVFLLIKIVHSFHFRCFLFQRHITLFYYNEWPKGSGTLKAL